MRYEAEYSGIRIKKECLKDLQNVLKVYPSIRFLYDPQFDRQFHYWRISIGGKAKEINMVCSEIYQNKWAWEKQKEKKKGFLKRLFKSS